MSYLLMVFGPLLLFMMITLFAVTLTGKKFGICIGPVLLLSPLFLFLGQIVSSTFSYAMIFLITLAVAGPVSLFFVKDKKIVLSNYLTNGLFVFVFIVAIELIVNAGAHVQEWDEYAHWAPMTVEMLHSDRFYNVAWTKVFEHKEYPPFAQLFEYIWIRCSGKFADSGLYTSLRVLEYSLILPLVADKKDSKIKSPISAFLLFFITVISISSYSGDGLVSQIRPDFLMAIMFGMSMYFIFRYDVYKEKLAWLYVMIMMMSLVLVKQVAIVFVLLCLALLAWRFVATIKERNILSDTAKFVVIAVVPLLARKLWTRSCLMEGISGGQFSYREKGIGNMLLEIFGIMKGEVTGDRANTFFDFVYAVFDKTIGRGLFRTSFAASMALILFVMILLLVISKKSLFNTIDGKMITGLAVTAGFGSILYTGMILITNLFFFSGSEMTSLACFERYMSTYLMAMLIVVGITAWDLVTSSFERSAKPGYLALVMLASIVLSGAYGLYELMPNVFKEDNSLIYRQNADFIDASTEKGSKVFVAADGMDDAVYLTYLDVNRDYYADRSHSDILCVSPDDNERIDWYINALAGYDYLFIADGCGTMNESFSAINDGEPFEEGGLYRISSEGDSVSLVRIAVNR